MPLPLTGTTRVAIRLLGLVEQVGLAAGPQSLNVIVPCAGPPSVTGLAGVPIDPAGLAPAGPPVPGCFAVGPRVAVSLSAFVISTFADAWVGSVGCTGAIVKHSPELLSLPGGPQVVVLEHSARKQ